MSCPNSTAGTDRHEQEAVSALAGEPCVARIIDEADARLGVGRSTNVFRAMAFALTAESKGAWFRMPFAYGLLQSLR